MDLTTIKKNNFHPEKANFRLPFALPIAQGKSLKKKCCKKYKKGKQCKRCPKGSLCG
jgi:hypothetical protein